MKNYLGFGIIVILLIFIYWEFQPKEKYPESVITTSAAASKSSKTTDYTASFVIFTHNSFRYFSDPQYHNRSEKVYIQADNPNIIRVKKAGITWGDFFKTLPMRLTKNCLTAVTGQNYCTGQGGELKFYLNGEKVPDIFSEEIKKGDKLLVSYGFETDDQITFQLEQIADPLSL